MGHDGQRCRYAGHHRRSGSVLGRQGPAAEPHEGGVGLQGVRQILHVPRRLQGARRRPPQPDITVLVPGDVACAEYSSVNGPLTKAVCEYHVIKGVVGADSLSSASLTTLEGSSITYRRMFRKHFVDNAITGAMAAPPRSSFKADIKADNGLVHMLNEVIYPGWTETDASVGSSTSL